MPGDYSEELVELVARTICDGFEVVPGVTPPLAQPCADCYPTAVAVLDALSSAGRLVPEGSEVREEWQITGEPGAGYPPYKFTWSTAQYDDAEVKARKFIEMIRAHGGWPDGPHLAHHTVITTPWTPAEPAQEER